MLNARSCPSTLLKALVIFGSPVYSAALISTSAQATLTICNNTVEQRAVAIGYQKDAEWISQGWWNVGNGDCQIVLNGDLQNEFYYYRAAVSGENFDGDGYNFCTENAAFDIVGDLNCGERGYMSQSFSEIILPYGTKDYTHTVTLEQTHTPKKISTTLTASNTPAEPGTYGEPISISGVYQGCEFINDGVLSCSLVADSWIYAVIDDGKTPQSLMRQLEKIEANETVHIAGDMVNVGDITVEITARDVSVITQSPMQATYNKLIGLWRSNDDTASSIRFTDDGRQISYYEGDLVSDDVANIQYDCPETGQSSDSPLLVVNDTQYGNFFCYGVSLPSSDTLELLYLSRGNFLNYTKEAN